VFTLHLSCGFADFFYLQLKTNTMMNTLCYTGIFLSVLQKQRDQFIYIVDIERNGNNNIS